MGVYLLFTPSLAPIHKGYDNPRKVGSTKLRNRDQGLLITKPLARMKMKNMWVLCSCLNSQQCVNNLFLHPLHLLSSILSLTPPPCFLLELAMIFIVILSFVPVIVMGYYTIWCNTIMPLHGYYVTVGHSVTTLVCNLSLVTSLDLRKYSLPFI